MPFVTIIRGSAASLRNCEKLTTKTRTKTGSKTMDERQ